MSGHRFDIARNTHRYDFEVDANENKYVVTLEKLVRANCWNATIRRGKECPSDKSTPSVFDLALRQEAPTTVLRALLDSNPMVTDWRDEQMRQDMFLAVTDDYSEEEKKQATELMEKLHKLENDEEMIRVIEQYDKKIHRIFVDVQGLDIDVVEMNDKWSPFGYALYTKKKLNSHVVAALAPTPLAAFYYKHCWDTIKNGRKLLHKLRNDRNDEPVLDLLRSYPSAACYSDRGNIRDNTWHPSQLNVALVEKRSDEIVLTILKACPQAASMLCAKNRAPLFNAILNDYSVEVIAALVRACHLALLAPVAGSAYYQVMWIENTKDEDSGDVIELPDDIEDPSYRKLWELIACSLAVAHYGNIPDDFEQRPFDEILHSVADDLGGYDSKNGLFHEAWKLFQPDWGISQDRNGDLPLHAIVRNPLVSNQELFAIKNVLDHDSLAATRLNREGLTPLVLALLSGRKWGEGVGVIVEASKHLVDQPDPRTGLYPFMVAASCGQDDVSTSYSLLRAQPGCMEHLLKTVLAEETDAAAKKQSALRNRLESIEKKQLSLREEMLNLEEELSRLHNSRFGVQAPPKKRRCH